MKKLFTLLCTLLVAAGAWAQTTYEAKFADGTNNPVGTLGTRNAAKTQLVSNDASGLEGVELTAGAFDQANWLNSRCLAIKVSAAKTAEKVTITAPDGYLITGYSIEAFTVSPSGCPYYIDTNATYTGELVPGGKTTYSVSGIETSSTYFWLYANAASVANWLGVSDFTVTLKRDPLYADPLSFLSNEKCYRLTTPRGSLGVNNQMLVATNKGYDASNFALVKYEDAYYMWSVAARRFVNAAGFTSNYKPSPITIKDLGSSTFQLRFGGNAINVSGSYAPGLVINNYTTVDEGNTYTIQEAGAFDATEALALLANPLSTATLTDLSQLSNSKCYAISNVRATWNVANGATAMSTSQKLMPDVTTEQFAIIQNGGNYYLYSVNAGKYLREDNTFGDPQAVTILPTGNASYPFFFKFSDTKNINVGGSNQITIDTWSSMDDGNRNAIIEAARFNPAQALSALPFEATEGELTDQVFANPSFEYSAAFTPLTEEQKASGGPLSMYGWTMEGVDSEFNNSEIRTWASTSTTSQFGTSVPSEGNYSFFFRHGWNGNGNVVTLSTQTLYALPPGIYTLYVDYKQHYSYDNTQNSNTKVELSVVNGTEILGSATSPAAGGVSGASGDATFFNVQPWNTLKLTFAVSEEMQPEIKVILNCAGQRRSDFFIDRLRLEAVKLAVPVEKLSNLSFDENPRYDVNSTVNLNTYGSANSGVIDGWLKTSEAPWCASATYVYGSAAQINGGAVPATAPEGSESTAALGISIGWNGTVMYQQYISSLPAGTYKLSYKAYNAGTATRFPSKAGVIVGNQQYLSSKTDFALNEWVTDEIEFTLNADASMVTLQVGATADNSTSTNHGKVFIDDIVLERLPDIGVARTNLLAALEPAEATVAAKQGVGAEIMQIPTETYNTYKQAVAAAKAVADNQDATLEELQQALAALNQATDAYANAEVNLPNPTAKYTIQLKDGGNYMALNEGTVLAANPVPFTIKETEGGYAITNGTEYVALKGGNAWAMNMSAEPYAWKINLLPDGYYTIAKASNANHVIGVDNTEAGSKCWADKSIATIGDKARWIIKTVVVEPDHGDSEDLVFNSAGTQLFELNNDEAITPNTGVQIDVTGTQIEKGIVVDYSGASVTNKETHECGFRATAIIQDSKGNVFEVKSRGDKETNIINVAEGLFGPNEEYTVTIKPIVYYDYDNFCDEIYDLWEAGKAAHQVADPADESWGWDTSKTPAETTKTGSSTILDPAWTLAAVAQQWSQDLKDNNAGSTYFGTEVVPFTDCDPLPLYVDSREYVFLIKTDGSVQSNVKALAAQDFKAWDAWGNDITAEFLSVGGGTATGIDKVQNAAKGAIYNLAGQRVAKTTKGIYVSGGRKVAVK